ncbi:sensor histidine kinase [Thermophagus sp. OGC60D27]|uniref:sensor histidine kinase n=1 Tax=Thermophagus sp. OGC60D27 TaxID=3458415 RepID=UPI00403823CB
MIWLFVMFLPVFTLQGARDFSSSRVYMEWIRLVPFLVVFLINNSLLVPQLLLKKRTLIYFLSVSLLVAGVALASPYLKIFQGLVFKWLGQAPPAFPRRLPGLSAEYRLATNVLISFLVVGFNNAIKLLIQREKEEKIREQKDNMHLQTELSFLRNQISPHFFMNTLNNIHALIRFDADQAQKSVVQLSTLMRHLLNESKSGTSTIGKEFEFLKSYVDLMRIRYSDKVHMDVSLDVNEKHKTIPSLLFVSLVENAFKHGVDSSVPCFVSISAQVMENTLIFEVKNSKLAPNQPSPGKTGVGLTNLKKQLMLLYQNNYSLDISDGQREFGVILKIPLSHD